MTDKPIGSGIFAAVVGLAFFCSVLIWPEVLSIDPKTALKMWMYFSGLMLIIWGIVRIVTANSKTDFRIGQSTINMVIGVIAATFAIMALK